MLAFVARLSSYGDVFVAVSKDAIDRCIGRKINALQRCRAVVRFN